MKQTKVNKTMGSNAKFTFKPYLSCKHLITICRNLFFDQTYVKEFNKCLRAIDFGHQKRLESEFLKVVAYDSTIGPHKIFFVINLT